MQYSIYMNSDNNKYIKRKSNLIDRIRSMNYYKSLNICLRFIRTKKLIELKRDGKKCKCICNKQKWE